MSKKAADEKSNATRPNEESNEPLTLPVRAEFASHRLRHVISVLLLVPGPAYLIALNWPNPAAGPSRQIEVSGWGFYALMVVSSLAVAAGLRAAYRFALTWLRKPGAIDVTETKVSLPTQLEAKSRFEIAPTDIRAAYVLRRAGVGSSGPILVVETAQRAFQFPRDWFLSDGDQHDVAEALYMLIHK